MARRLLAAALFLVVPSAAGADEATTHANTPLTGKGVPGPFDPRHFSEGPRFGLSLQRARFASDLRYDETGIEGSFGVASHTRRGALLLYGASELAVRSFGLSDWSVALGRHHVVGGIALGPLELFAGPGVSLIVVDRLRGDFGLGLISPRVGTGAALRFGRVRVDAMLYGELLWRWTGQDVLVRGLSLAMSVDRPPALPRAEVRSAGVAVERASSR